MERSVRRLRALVLLARIAPAILLTPLAWGQAFAQNYELPAVDDAGEPIIEPHPDISPHRVALILARHGYRFVGPLQDRGDEILASGVDADGSMMRFVIDPRDDEVVRSWPVEPGVEYGRPREIAEGPGEMLGPENYGRHVPPTAERLGTSQRSSPDRYGTLYQPAPATPQRISEDFGPEASRRRVERKLLEPFTLPETVDPFIPGRRIATQGGPSGPWKGGDPPRARGARNSNRRLTSYSIPHLAASQARTAEAASVIVDHNLRRSALAKWSAAPSRSAKAPMSNAAATRPIVAAPARSEWTVTRPAPIGRTRAPVTSSSSGTLISIPPRSSSPPPNGFDKPSAASITNEAEPKSNLNGVQ
jgi:hypothetical protein